jgi:hypothetical protein
MERKIYTIRDCDKEDLLNVLKILQREQLYKELELDKASDSINQKELYFITLGYYHLEYWEEIDY